MTDHTTGDVVDITSVVDLEINVDAAPKDTIPAFKLRLRYDGQVHDFALPEPDGSTAMDLEEQTTSRGFLRLAFDDQWPTARPMVEAIQDREELMKLALRYSRHFQIDPANLVEDSTPNREERRRRRRGRR